MHDVVLSPLHSMDGDHNDRNQVQVHNGDHKNGRHGGRPSVRLSDRSSVQSHGRHDGHPSVQSRGRRGGHPSVHLHGRPSDLLSDHPSVHNHGRHDGHPSVQLYDHPNVHLNDRSHVHNHECHGHNSPKSLHQGILLLKSHCPFLILPRI